MADEPATTIEPADDVVVVRILCKDLDENHIKAVRADLATASEKHQQPFVLDMAKVKFVPSLTLGLLVRISNEFRARNQRLVLAGLQRGVRQVLSITRLDRLFDIQESVDTAKRDLQMK